jgi:hypothetical protein
VTAGGEEFVLVRSLSDRDWQTLVYSIRQERCVLLVGPDIPLVDEGSACRSLAGELAAELAGELATPPPPTATLAEVAQQYVAELGRDDLEMGVTSFFRRQGTTGSRVHDDLAAIGFPFVVSSCYDTLLEAAMQRAGRSPVWAHYQFRGQARDLVHQGTIDAPLVYHLHGSLTEPDSLVLTETDLLDFLVAVISNKPPLPHNVRSHLQEKGRSFLFVGFGMNRWHLRILVHVLRGPRPESRSFALEPSAGETPADYRQAVMFYRRGFKVEVFEVDLARFVAELRERVESEPGSAPKPAAPALVGSQPRVFISYDRRNASAAQRIYDHLEKSGCDPWLDHERLKGGTDWNARIESEIQETDYFVLVHSKEVTSKIEGYVVQEINLACNRITYFRRDVSFLVPAVIDDAPLMSEVARYQAVDLRAADGLDCLVSTIRKDWQRRHK